MKRSVAGTEEKNDVLVELVPLGKGDGTRIEIISPVKKQFGRLIEESVRDVLNRRGVDDVQVIVKDNKALDFALRARLEAAIDRAGGEHFAS
ncbi:MAG: citrate lyase acyl carrier protein [Thermoanaerobacteraceae bacterium]|nr:citrate lyase acyl carrier protein [Thermoanaerobacteraceae bacterium]